jgi:hypothetical protein
MFNLSATIGAIDLSATRVPIIVPLAVASAFGVAQLFLGTNPVIVLMSVAAIAVTFIPLNLYGRDLYSLLALLFGVRYVGVALIVKTFYGQALETNLYDPFPTYALTLLLMIVETTVILLARKLDPGTTLIPFPTDLRNLRRLAIIAYSIGFAGIVVVGRLQPGEGVAGAGVAFIAASAISGLCALGLIAETAYSIAKSNGRSLFTPMLAFMLIFTLMAVIALNERAFFLSCIIGVSVIAFIYKAISFRYVVGGLLIAVFFSSFLSPLTLYLRAERKMAIGEFIELAENTAVKMLVDPNFRKIVTDTAKYQSLQDINDTPSYDYYGDRSNVWNRVSFVGLLDAVYNASKARAPLGMEALKTSIVANSPGFLGFSKLPYDLGDWLAWQMGMLEPGLISYLNFGLPMEGLATWGWVGFIAYPFIFMFPVLLIYARISSLRLATPVSVFLFTDLQHGIVEMTSDGFIEIALKGAPLLFLILFGLYQVFFHRSSGSAPASIASSQH